jgi:hypothetical protein
VAPLLALHESYADHLFEGTDVAVLPGITASCDRFPRVLAMLHLECARSPVPFSEESAAELAKLRRDADRFCQLFRPIMEALEASETADLDDVEEASEAGLFAEIHALNEGLDALFTSVVDGFEVPEVRWCFAVAFAARAIANRGSVDRITQDLSAVFYGAESAVSIPFSVPDSVAKAMTGLIGLVGIDLDAEASAQAVAWAHRILEHFAPSLE